MAEDTQHILLVSVGNGMILSQGTSQLVARTRDNDDKTQRWILEPGEDERTFALKNVGNGKYMWAKSCSDGGDISTSDEKTWWIWNVQPECAPGAVHIAPKERPKAALNHQSARYAGRGASGARVQMWSSFDGSTPNYMSWWFMDAECEPGPQGMSASGAASKAEAAAREEELAAKMRDLEERESTLAQARKEYEEEQIKTKGEAAKADIAREDEALAKLKELEDREAALAQQQKDVEAQRARSEEEMAKARSDLEEKAAALDKRQKEAEASRAKRDDGAAKAMADLEARKLALDARMKEMDQREARIERSQKDAADLEARELALAAKYRDAGTKEAQIAQARKEVDAEAAKVKKQELALAAETRKQAEETKDKLEALQRREAALMEREKKQLKGSGSQKAAAARAQEMLDDLQAREKALAARERKDVEEREKKLKTLQTREAAVEAREKALIGQQAMTRPASTPSNAGSRSPAQANSTKQRKHVVVNNDSADTQFQDLQERLAKLEKAYAATRQTGGSRAGTSPSTPSAASGLTTPLGHKHGKAGPPRIQCRCGYTG